MVKSSERRAATNDSHYDYDYDYDNTNNGNDIEPTTDIQI